MEEEQPRRGERPQILRAAEFSAGGVLGRGFAVWARRFPSLLLLVLLVYLPLLIYKGVELSGETPFHDRTRFWGELIARLLLGFVATAAVIYAVLSGLRGERASLRDSLRTIPARIPAVIGASILQVIPLTVTVLITGLLAAIHFTAGFVGLLFVAYIYSMLWMMIPAVVVERAGPFAALKRSIALTRGSRLRILLVLLVVWAIRIGAGALIVRGTSGETTVIVDLLATLVLGALEATMNAVAYHDLRRAKEGVGVDELLSVFA